jgi:anti-anti-sigma regulatory factor
MLRISVDSDPGSVTFRLEGRLAGSWVQELHDCWQRTFAASPKPSVRFDLSDVTYIDAAGKEFLAARYREGHKLIAAGCLMKFIVAEITGLPMPVPRSSCATKESAL